jgi:DNA-binding HxlR family transcriptional regulator
MKEIQEFLEKRGSIDILFNLAEEEKSFNELESLNLSPNTVLSRLREAQALNLIEEKLLRQKEGRSKIKYVLTKKGKEIMDVSKSFKKDYLKLREEINGLEENIRKKEEEIKTLLSSMQRSLPK